MDRRYGKGTYYSSAYVGQPGYECIDVANDQGSSARGCSNQALNIDVSSNLTKKQQYTLKQDWGDGKQT